MKNGSLQIVLLLCFALMSVLPSCSGGSPVDSARPQPVLIDASPGSGGSLLATTSPAEDGLPAPDRLPAAAGPALSRFCFAGDFETELPHSLLSAEGTDCHIQASDTAAGGASTPFKQAYAIYRFSFAGEPPSEVTLKWQSAPDVQSRLWIGLADWKNNRWRFHEVADIHSLSITNMDAYVGPQGEAALVLLAELDKPAVLSWLRFGGNMPPAAQLSADPPQGIVPFLFTLDPAQSVDPDGAIVRYEWDLNDDGYFEHRPETLEALTLECKLSGEQQYRLRVTTADGESDISSITVRGQLDAEGGWSHTWGNSSSSMAGVGIDRFDNLHMATYIPAFVSGWDKLAYLVYNSNGTLRHSSAWYTGDSVEPHALAISPGEGPLRCALLGYNNGFPDRRGPCMVDFVDADAQQPLLFRQAGGNLYGAATDLVFTGPERRFICGSTATGPYVLRLDSQTVSLTRAWQADAVPTDIAAMPDGGVCLVGTIAEPSGERRIFITRLDSEGQNQWRSEWKSNVAPGLSSRFRDEVYCSTNSAGDIFVTTTVRETSLHAGQDRGLLLKFNGQGQLKMARRLVTQESIGLYGLSIAADGSLYIAGSPASLWHLAADGSILSGQQWLVGSYFIDDAQEVVLDSAGMPYLAGRASSHSGHWVPRAGVMEVFGPVLESLSWPLDESFAEISAEPILSIQSGVEGSLDGTGGGAWLFSCETAD